MRDSTNAGRLGWHSLGTRFDCACGQTHELPIERCHIGEDAADRLAEFAAERAGKYVLVVCDENVRDSDDERLVRALRDAGKRVREKVYGREPLDATDELGDEVAEAALEADCIVGFGAGTLCDLAKYAGDRLGKPVLLYPTAASMNGYTSAIVALKVRGLKRTLPCRPAAGVFADPRVAATAPARMNAAGVADFLSKCSSSSDWRAGHFLRGGYYCERPREFFEGAQERILAAAPRVRTGDVAAVAVVLDCLLLSGLSMVVAGSSAPASGGEHLISHYLDMKSALYGTPHDLHGAQVGVGTLHCLRLWERLLKIEPVDLDIEACIAAQPEEDRIRAWIEEDWGPVAPEVREQWRGKALSLDALRRELLRFRDGLPELRRLLARDLLPSATVEKAIRDAGGPTTPEELDAPREEYAKALRFARFIRNRFTVLDLAAEAGMDARDVGAVD
jgi:glycerol-1-phosphate dehydrogenase [NAD(P)+]